MRRKQEDKAEKLYKKLRNIQDSIVNEEFMLSAKSPKGTMKVEVGFAGTPEELLGLLAHIVDDLNTQTVLSEDDIIDAVKMGLRGKEDAKEKTRQELKEVLEELGIFDD